MVNQKEIAENEDQITIKNPVDLSGVNNYINNTKTQQIFKFKKIFNEQTQQQQIFDEIARDVIDSALDGFNGTIFAYGQSGSGKTFTMTGGALNYDDRGIIPRTVSYLFERINNFKNKKFEVSVSYMEIYNNQGYDLLHQSDDKEHRSLDDLPRIKPFIKDDGILLKNLNVQKAKDEEDLLNTLFVGDTNRVICETPLNDVSTRSHCVFTIYLESQEIGSEHKIFSKINLVDLSGSERIGKTHVTGKLQKEAININLSLHYLEQVIVMLQKKAKGEKVFVPYRNSLMTMMLKDSLGGNCKTKMISTVYLKEDNLLESMATCNFSQRVALIENLFLRNQVIDPNILISKLKSENHKLKQEIAIIKNTKKREFLSNEDVQFCAAFVQNFLIEQKNEVPCELNDQLMILQCFKNFKEMVLQKDQNDFQSKDQKFDDNKNNQLQDEIKTLKTMLLQKDKEIESLIQKNEQLLKENNIKEEEEQQEQALQFVDYNDKIEQIQKQQQPKINNFLQNQNQKDNKENKSNNQQNQFKEILFNDIQLIKEDFNDKKYCFDLFRKQYKFSDQIEQEKQNIKNLYNQGKAVTKIFKNAKQKIMQIKEEIEIIKKRHAIENIMNPNADQSNLDNQELQYFNQISQQKEIYQNNYNQAAQIKQQIQQREIYLSQKRKKMEQDFHYWLKMKYKQQKEQDYQQQNNYSQVTQISQRTRDNLREIEELKKHINYNQFINELLLYKKYTRYV